jgi:hypothetical protein
VLRVRPPYWASRSSRSPRDSRVPTESPSVVDASVTGTSATEAIAVHPAIVRLRRRRPPSPARRLEERGGGRSHAPPERLLVDVDLATASTPLHQMPSAPTRSGAQVHARGASSPERRAAAVSPDPRGTRRPTSFATGTRPPPTPSRRARGSRTASARGSRFRARRRRRPFRSHRCNPDTCRTSSFGVVEEGGRHRSSCGVWPRGSGIAPDRNARGRSRRAVAAAPWNCTNPSLHEPGSGCRAARARPCPSTRAPSGRCARRWPGTRRGGPVGLSKPSSVMRSRL